MTLKEINSYIINAENYINEVPNDIINQYIIDNRELRGLINWENDYDVLREIYSKTTTLIYEAKELASKYKGAEDIIYKLFSLRRLCVVLIQTHPKDSGRFKRDNNLVRIEKQEELTYFKFHSKNKGKLTFNLLRLYRLLIDEERLGKSQNQRKAFISLFFSEKRETTPIIWLDVDSDLRGFLTAIIDTGVISFNPTDINKFASNNFNTLKSSGKYTKVRADTFRQYQKKESYYKANEKWVKLLKTI